MFDLIQKFAFELTIGAFGYLLRKWYGEELSKYIFTPMMIKLKRVVLSPIATAFRHRLIRSQREAAIWLHYRNKAHNKGHQHRNPLICKDDHCRFI